MAGAGALKSEYPKEMHHPGFTPAILSDDTKAGPNGGRFREAPPGMPARFPPVVVNNPDQEEYHASRGYVVGKQHMPLVTQYTHKERENIRMREVPQADEPPPTGEYPKWVGDKIAKNAEEEAKILADAAAIESMRAAGDRWASTKTEFDVSKIAGDGRGFTRAQAEEVLGTTTPPPLTAEQVSARGSATFMPDPKEWAQFQDWKAAKELDKALEARRVLRAQRDSDRSYAPREKRYRRPMTPEQRQRAADNLARARAVKRSRQEQDYVETGPAGNE